MLSRRSFRYRVVDVFTRVPLEGNPLAVFLDSEGLDDGTMQRIAKEMNLSETVFITEASLPECVRALRIFTPAREMVFAGHPTVGAGYVLLDSGILPGKTGEFCVEEKIGPVRMRVEAGDSPVVWLETPAICFEKEVDRKLCARVLQLDPKDLLPIEPQIVTAGNPTLLVAVKDRTIVDRAVVDSNLWFMLSRTHPAPFCLFVFAPVEGGAYSRMFAPEYGIIEDPATGSSTGPLAAFMNRYNLLSKGNGRFVSEQGTKMGRRSLLQFEFCGNGRDRIFVGGHVTPVAEAVMFL